MLRHAQVLFVLFAILWTMFILRPGLEGGYFFDDYHVLVSNTRLHLEAFSPMGLLDAAFSVKTGPLERPLTLVTFAVQHVWSGLDPFYFKAGNLLIHCLNGVLVYVLLSHICASQPNRGQSRVPNASSEHRHSDPAHLDAAHPNPAHLNPAHPSPAHPSPAQHQLPGAGVVPMLGALLFLLHPFNVGAVFYVVQRMTLLSTTFLLIALLALVALINAQRGKGSGLQKFASVAVLLAAIFFGLLSKETAATILLLGPLVYFFLSRHSGPRNLKLVAVALLAPAVFFAALIWQSPILEYGLTTEVPNRAFSLYARLLTESTVLMFYFGQTLLPRLSEMQLFHDDWVLYRELIHPTVLVSLFVLVAGSCAAVVAVIKKQSLIGFGVIWFLLSHLLESSIIPLELVHEHRNYLPSIGLCLCLATLIVDIAFRFKPTAIRVGFLLVAVSLFSYLAHQRALHWSTPLEMTVSEARDNPASYRSQMAAARESYIAFRKTANDLFLEQAIAHTSLAQGLRPSTVVPELKLLGYCREPERHAPRVDCGRAHLGLEEIGQQLRVAKLDHADVSALMALSDCEKGPRCALSQDEIEDIFDAALRNHGLRDSDRAKLLTATARWRLAVEGPSRSTVALATQAALLQPGDPTYMLNLAMSYMVVGQTDTAASLLQKTEAFIQGANPVVRFKYLPLLAKVRALRDRLSA